MTQTLITVAPTGAESSKSDVPALPVTLDELVTTAKECQALGAAVVHVHVRDGDAQPTLDPVRLRDTVQALRTETDLIVQLSTGGAVTDPEADRLAVLDAEPDAASCSMGTVNFGRDVFMNRWDFIVELHTAMRDREIVPEYEIFDLGQMAALQRLLDKHGLPYGGHVHADLVMGVPGGMPGTAAALVAAVAMLPKGSTFAATGVGRTTLPVMLAALSGGGHLRVGMEDTITFVPGQPVTGNPQLVERAAGVARLADRPPMPIDEARSILGVRDRRSRRPLEAAEGDRTVTLKSYDEMQVGDRASLTRLVTDEMVRDFAELSGDRNPLHLDDDFAGRTRWQRRLVHGALSNAFISAALTELSVGWVYLSQETAFMKPAFPGDSVTAEVLVTEKRPPNRMVLHTEIRIGDEIAARGTAVMQELGEASFPPG